MMKRCYYCGWLLPLFMFSKNRRRYQNATNKGRNYSCRTCNYRRWSRDMSAWLWNEGSGKFERVEFKNKTEVLKRTLR